MKILKRSTLLLTALLMVGGSLVSAAPNEFTNSDSITIDFAQDQQIQSKIDSLVTGKERTIMAEVLSRLAPEDRENVMFVDENGKIYSNKVAIIDSTENYTSIGDNQYRSTSGLTITGPGNYAEPIDTAADDSPLGGEFFTNGGEFSTNSVIPTQTGGSGPYRRVYSNDGFSWMSTYVTLPGGTNIKDSNSTGLLDTAFVYLGGWSSNSTGIDAGMQHSTAYDDWAPTTLANNAMQPSPIRFKANQDIYMKFYITNTNEATLAVSGIGTDGVSKTVTIVRAGVSGWNKDGIGSRLKRMTTIGQKGGESMTTGSYMKGVHWNDITIGRYDSNTSSANLIYSSWGSSQTGGFQLYQRR
ncbi:hypothetical protein J7E73_20530 [Paenibacillus albidus]|uniref:hypothetical protein n=1 Tax=Paenibacillus albidus TaxID=2041023 RepID=UPI001BEAA49C|nr:hypothetical protein [Paenibacillus albidus]MBT2291464.1 hypothetical protein [Paenibacillus albidus]